MIGRLTETSLTAAQLGTTYEQMAWPQDPISYDNLREVLLELLAELDVGVDVPATQEEFTESRGQLSRAITGTGVKLGIKVAEAVRKSMKGAN